MRDAFYRVTRCIVHDNGKLRLTETHVCGYYTDTGEERITTCCGKIRSYPAKSRKNAATQAA